MGPGVGKVPPYVLLYRIRYDAGMVGCGRALHSTPMELDFRPKKTVQTRLTWKDASFFAENFSAVPSKVE
jgi:hypothetical protein